MHLCKDTVQFKRTSNPMRQLSEDDGDMIFWEDDFLTRDETNGRFSEESCDFPGESLSQRVVIWQKMRKHLRSDESLPINDLISKVVDQEGFYKTSPSRRAYGRMVSLLRHSRLAGMPLSIFYGCFIYSYMSQFVLNDFASRHAETPPTNFTTHETEGRFFPALLLSSYRKRWFSEICNDSYNLKRSNAWLRNSSTDQALDIRYVWRSLASSDEQCCYLSVRISQFTSAWGSPQPSDLQVHIHRE